MKQKALMVLQYTPGAIKLTEAQARLLFTDTDIEKGEQRGETKSIGPWQIPVTYQALCTSNIFYRDTYPVEHGPLHVYGKRVLFDLKASGYQLEGRVKVNGVSRRGFTSTQLFELPNGKLIDAAIIHACGAAEAETAAE